MPGSVASLCSQNIQESARLAAPVRVVYFGNRTSGCRKLVLARELKFESWSAMKQALLSADIQHAMALATLLLEWGADPNDSQGL